VTRARTSLVLAGLLTVLGIVILIRTAVAGGGQIGYLLGSLMVLAGIGRAVLMRYGA